MHLKLRSKTTRQKHLERDFYLLSEGWLSVFNVITMSSEGCCVGHTNCIKMGLDLGFCKEDKNEIIMPIITKMLDYKIFITIMYFTIMVMQSGVL